MLEKINLKKILFLDVETVPMMADYNDLPEAFQQLWDKKADRIDTREEKDPRSLFFERAGIYSEFGKIVCICRFFSWRRR